MHQEVDFLLWPFPVFAGQAVERQLLHANGGAFFGNLSYRIDATTMAFDAW